MTYHTSGSIEGLLQLSNEELGRMFDNDPKSTRFDLETRKENGAKLIPAEGCDNFDPIRGCLGHGEGVKSKLWANSSNLCGATYNRDDKKMSVQFKNGNVYQYTDVPEKVWDEFITAKSGGSYLAKNITKQYPSTKIL